MAEGPDYVPGTVTVPTAAWKSEILDFLLGRLTRDAHAARMRDAQSHEFAVVPVRRWWIFEGKQYRYLESALIHALDRIVVVARRLQATLNPRIRLVDRPEGEIDWVLTFARGPFHQYSDYVVRSSAVGLDEMERRVLREWIKWIAGEWQEYAAFIGSDRRLDVDEFEADEHGPVPIERIRRWAHVARRSRWPLLRDVVAETLRPLLEPTDLDALPLPKDPSSMFELLCLVRVARYFEPAPQVRWIGSGDIGNTLQIGKLCCEYQSTLKKQIVLQTPDYQGSLGRAIEAFHVRLPQRMDVIIEFLRPHNGFDGLIIEAKSGVQEYASAVAQLRTYRQALSRERSKRYVVWGVVERRQEIEATPARVRELLAATAQHEDLWVFSSADSIREVLGTLFPAADAP